MPRDDDLSSDRLYAKTQRGIEDFTFDAKTATVFDDMLNRSVPLYGEIQRLIRELAGDFAADGTTVYDLGCSTGNTFVPIAHHLPSGLNVRFVGIDSSTVYQGLNHNGCFILIEKILARHSLFNRLFIKHYYEMKKRSGYSDLEIAQKREALENILVPYRRQENERLLEQVGFSQVETFFQWYNFSGMIALKSAGRADAHTPP